MLAFGAWDGLERWSHLHPSDAPVCTATMLPLAPERCYPLHQGDALSCTKSNRAYRLILEEVFPRLEGKLSRASKGDLPAPRRETFPCLGGRSCRKAKGRLPARRRETFTQQQPDYSINTKLL